MEKTEKNLSAEHYEDSPPYEKVHQETMVAPTDPNKLTYGPDAESAIDDVDDQKRNEKLNRRLDMRILPLCCWIYLLNFLVSCRLP